MVEQGRGQQPVPATSFGLVQHHSELIGQAGACVAAFLKGRSAVLHDGEKQKTCQ